MHHIGDLNKLSRRDGMVRVEGELEVWEPIDAVEYVSPFDRRCSRMIWRPYFCVLLPQERTLVHYSIKYPPQALQQSTQDIVYQTLMGTGGSSRAPLKKIDEAKTPAFTDSVENIQEAVSAQEKATSSPRPGQTTSSSSQSSSDRRRGSVPSRADAYKNDHMTTADTSKKSSFLSFFHSKSKKTTEKVDGSLDPVQQESELPLKRSLSLGRLRRSLRRFSFGASKQQNSTTNESDVNANQPVSCGPLKAWFSHESLLSSSQQHATVMNKLSLPVGQTSIRDLHLSVLQREHCFELSTPEGARCYCTKTADSHREWMNNLSSTIDADQATKNRVENSLTIFVAEAKNVASKKRCFCEVYVDDRPAAKTTSKLNENILFWGEQFELKSLPNIQTVTIKLYEQADNKKKKEGKQLLGIIEIPSNDVSNSHSVEKWYSLNSPSNNKKTTSAEAIQLRVKARYQSVPILPVVMYEELVYFLESQYKQLVESLEPLLSTKVKEDISDSLVRVMIGLGHDVEFLTDVTMAEVSKIENIHLTFRGNSLATKAVEAHLKIVAEKYVRQTLEDVIHSLIDNGGDCEVDTNRLSGKYSLSENQQRLCESCQTVWYKIFNSSRAFPVKLKSLFGRLRHCCAQMQYHDVSDHLISACVFLRLLCPAILSPNLFHLTQEFPTAKAARTLTLVAKTVQTLANFSEFGNKEDYMTFMNNFIESESANMKKFLHLISDELNHSGRDNELDSPCIDIGLELSVLHAKLSDILNKQIPDKPNGTALNSVLENLKQILLNITAYSQNPEVFQRKVPTLQPPPSRVAVDGDVTVANEQLQMTRARRQSRPESWNMSMLMNDLTQVSNTTLPKANDSVSKLRQPIDEVKVEENWRQIVSAADTASSGHVTLVPFGDDRVRKLSSSRPPIPPKCVSSVTNSNDSISLSSPIYPTDTSTVTDVTSKASLNGSEAQLSTPSGQQPLVFYNAACGMFIDSKSHAKSSEQLNVDVSEHPRRSPNWTRTMPAVAARTHKTHSQRVGQRTEPPEKITHPRLPSTGKQDYGFDDLKRSNASLNGSFVVNNATSVRTSLSQALPPIDNQLSVSLPRPLDTESVHSNGDEQLTKLSALELKSDNTSALTTAHSISLQQLHDEVAKKSAALRLIERRDHLSAATLCASDNQPEFV